MRGHVVDGARITMRDGSVLTIKSVVPGWVLLNQAGTWIGQPTNDAYVLTSRIVSY